MVYLYVALYTINESTYIGDVTNTRTAPRREGFGKCAKGKDTIARAIYVTTIGKRIFVAQVFEDPAP